ncbi:MAG TPA: WXG100 family type VII secretion target [Chloroflexota bacterium]|nr:WXG100 family type VII secretion target [Chloroflexota bacterium]
MNYVVQAKSDDLTEISQSLKKQEEAIGELKRTLTRMNDRLKQGWIGLGSEAYFAEAERLVLPAVQRLADALGEASRMVTAVANKLGTADQQASSSFKDSQGGAGQAAATAAQAATRPAGGAQAAGGGGIGGGAAAALAGQHLASRLDSAGFGSADSLPSLGTTFGSGMGTGFDFGSGLASSLGGFGFTGSDLMPASDWMSSSGLGDGGGYGGGGVGGGGGGGGVSSALGALRGQAGAGFGLSGVATGDTPDVTYSGLGGFGAAGGPRPMNFGMPMAIAAASPFAALLGKVIKDRSQAE